MKTQYVRNIPVNNADGIEICRFTGSLSWESDMSAAHIIAGTFEFSDVETASAFNTPALYVDENGKGGIFCLYY